jgi:hypothetical protein
LVPPARLLKEFLMSGKLPLGSEKRPTVVGGSSSVSWGNGRQMSKKKTTGKSSKSTTSKIDTA